MKVVTKRHKNKIPTQSRDALAPAEGIEPTFSVLETDALPLHHAGASSHFINRPYPAQHAHRPDSYPLAFKLSLQVPCPGSLRPPFPLSLQAKRGNLVGVGDVVPATGLPRRCDPRNDKLGTQHAHRRLRPQA